MCVGWGVGGAGGAWLGFGAPCEAPCEAPLGAYPVCGACLGAAAVQAGWASLPPPAGQLAWVGAGGDTMYARLCEWANHMRLAI